MKLLALSLGLVEHTRTVLRLLVLALAAFAVALSQPPADPAWLPLFATYAAIALTLLLFASRLSWPWLIYPIAIIDIGFVAAVVQLLPASPLPMWVLYLFPLAGVAMAGGMLALIAAGLSIAGYLGGDQLSDGSWPLLTLWPVFVLLSTACLVVVVASRGAVERREKRAWREIAAAARCLGATFAPGEVAQMVAQRACRLVRADAAWLWCYDEAGQLHPGPYVGPSAELPLLLSGFTRPPAGRLDRGTMPLAALGEPFASLVGDVVLLGYGAERLALLAVLWNKPPVDHATRRRRLRLFAPWAADALAQARAIATAREALRRETVLRQAAADLAATLDPQQAQESILGAARTALGATVSLVEVPSGRIVGGDAMPSEALLQLLFCDGMAAQAPKPSARQPDAPLQFPIGDNLLLVAWQAEQRFQNSDSAWLKQLGTVARVALDRCAVHGQLVAEERLLRASVEAMPAPVVVYDAAGVPVLANAAHRAVDLKRPALVDLPPGEVREEEVLAGTPPRTFVAMTASLAEGQATVSVYRDITREREALRAKDELIAMVGHELRSPLTSIFGYSQVMARQLGVVQRQVNQLNQLIGDFMDAAQLESNQLPLIRQAINLADVARGAADRFRGAYDGRHLRLELADVPEVEGDPARLGQVIDNLLNNAAKYSPADQEIVLGVERRQRQVALYVLDHGAGIAPEHLPHLFERFYRAPGAHTKRVKGLGLGLSIVRDLVIAHGGQVWAESAGPGRGSRFWVSLPAIASDDDALGVAPGVPWRTPGCPEERDADSLPARQAIVPLRVVHKTEAGA